MKREVHPEELEKLYDAGDMVRADCGGCHGCSACCRGMGSSVVLDPYDLYQLTCGLGLSLQQLIGREMVELNLADGLILPNLKMAGEKEQCVFLNEEGRCRIHAFRPGLCRLFPLGRYYEGDSFRYYLQLYECPKPNKTKVKVDKWLGIPRIRKYEEFTQAWHRLLMRCRAAADRADAEQKKDVQTQAGIKQDQAENGNTDGRRQITMYLLSVFYLTPYDTETDFYGQFADRLEKAGSDLAAFFVK